jgi:hypothetical protein
MLGPPTYIGYRGSSEVKKPGFVYRLGPEREYPGIDIEYLALDFDSTGKVYNAHVFNR